MATHPPPASDSDADFARVVCAIDASPQSVEAARQAVALGADTARYWGVATWDPGLAMYAGTHAAEVMTDLRAEAATALADIHTAFPVVTPVLMRGGTVAVLLAAIANFEADLISVGSHGNSRAAGVLFGSIATAMTHHAPCPVLVAREPQTPSFPGLIVHANDGSPESLDAAVVAGRIAARHRSTLITLHVTENTEADTPVVEQGVKAIETTGQEPVLRLESGSPHRRIVEVANELHASLIVIGSRGRTGLAALGSVSERVVHNASCSVLVVRRPAHPVNDADFERVQR